MGEYPFGHDRPMDEPARLLQLAAGYDERTIDLLERVVNVNRGWRCLEVGAGSGSIARWLAYRVGPHGHVLATDTEPRLGEDATLPHLKSLRHDIATEDIPDAPYDLVHLRLLLDVLPTRSSVISKLAAAVRPGGWLVLEEFDSITFSCVSGSADAHDRFASVLEALRKWTESRGGDTRLGSKIPSILADLDVFVEIRATAGLSVRRSGTPEAGGWTQSVNGFRDSLEAGGWIPTGVIDAHLDDLRTQAITYLPPLMVSTLARKAVETASPKSAIASSYP